MSDNQRSTLPIAVAIVMGFLMLALALPQSVKVFRNYERTVTVKGLSEREVPADIVIWPITFTVASNDIQELYRTQQVHAEKIKALLLAKGVQQADISTSSPVVVDKSAQQYGTQESPYRYVSLQTITVYSSQVASVREAMPSLSELGKEGIIFTGEEYQKEYVFAGLNALKPGMVEESTRQAREVAEKFAKDSNSQLGKIRQASQGQFSIEPRDKNNPHIKKVRVVSTVEYYLAD